MKAWLHSSTKYTNKIYVIYYHTNLFIIIIHTQILFFRKVKAHNRDHGAQYICWMRAMRLGPKFNYQHCVKYCIL